MTADIRTAAQREAEKDLQELGEIAAVSEAYNAGYMDGMRNGAEFGAARVTPTREQIGDALDAHGYDTVLEMCDCGWDQNLADDNDYGRHLADALLALMKELAEGGN